MLVPCREPNSHAVRLPPHVYSRRKYGSSLLMASLTIRGNKLTSYHRTLVEAAQAVRSFQQQHSQTPVGASPSANIPPTVPPGNCQLALASDEGVSNQVRHKCMTDRKQTIFCGQVANTALALLPISSP